MNKTPNLSRLLNESFIIEDKNWSHPNNIKFLEEARKEFKLMHDIISALSEYGPDVDLWDYENYV